MTTKYKAIYLLLFFSTTNLVAQEYKETFRSTRLINNHTTEIHKPGILELRISHRFGSLNSGAGEFWGLDQATIRIGLEYGLNSWINIGLGRSSYEKTVDSYVKFRILQENNWNIVGYSNMAINTLPYKDPDAKNYFSSRLTFVNQLLVSKKLNDAISLMLIPSLIHKNLVIYENDPNTQFTLGVGGKFNITPVTSIQTEYHYLFKDNDEISTQDFNNSFSIGLGFETKGHFFEFHLTNSAPMVEKGFLTETTGSWMDGDIRVGFNIVRDFKVHKQKK